jgi:hypothetical protein
MLNKVFQSVDDIVVDKATPAVECPRGVVGSTGERNTLVFSQRWSVGDEAAKSDLLFCSSAVRDLGSVAGWRVDEVDRATV